MKAVAWWALLALGVVVNYGVYVVVRELVIWLWGG